MAILDKERMFPFTDYGLQYSVFNTLNKRINKDFFRGKGTKTIKIKTIILDKYCKNNSIKPNFIKIDAEGTEYLILQGMSYLLKSSRPIISLEMGGGKEWQKNCQESSKTLLKNNYLPFRITFEGKLDKTIIEEEYKYENLIFVPKEKLWKIKH